MAQVMNYPMTRQGVRNLDNPIRPSRGNGVNVGADERVASTVAGAVLAGVGMGRGGIVGLIFAAVGGALAYRGYTGHCSAYAAAGINTAR